MLFKDYIRGKREAKGFSIRQLAGMAEIDPTYLSRIEAGRTDPPSEEVMVRLARAIEEDLDVMLGMAGRVSRDMQAVIAEHPKEFRELIRQLKGKSGAAITRVVKGIRDGEW